MNSKDLEYYLKLEGLKHVTRYQPFQELQESVAGHIYMTVILANDIMEKYNLEVDKAKVINLLLIHDLTELGMQFDYPADILSQRPELQVLKEQQEKQKIENISNTFSRPHLKVLFEEFESCTTPEAKFANFIDKLESSIYILSNKCAGFHDDKDFEFVLNYITEYRKLAPQLYDFTEILKTEIQKCYDRFKKTR